MSQIIKKISVLFFCGMGLLYGGCEIKTNSNEKPILSEKLILWTADIPDFWKAVGKEFQSNQLNQNIEVQVIDFPDQESLHEKLLDSILENHGPDIIYTNDTWIQQNHNKLTPLTEKSALSIPTFKNTFLPIAETLIKKEKIWGVPISIKTLGLYYNREHQTEILEQEAYTAFKTWKDFTESTTKLSRQDKSFERFSLSGTALGRVDNITHGVEIFQNMLLQNTKDFFSKAEDKFSFADDTTEKGKKINPGEKTLLFFKQFSNPLSPHYSWNEFITNHNPQKDLYAFATGKVSTMFGFPQDRKAIENIIKNQNQKTISINNVMVAPFPQWDEKNPKIWGYVQALAVPRSTQNHELAWQFLTFAIKPETARGFFNTTQLPTAHKELSLEQEANRNLKPFVKQARFAESKNFPLKAAKINQAFRETLESPETNLKNTQKTLNTILQAKKILEKKLPSPPSQ